MTFIDRIISTFSTYPHKEAFCIQNKFYSYQELISVVASYQKHFNEQCISEHRIGIIVTDDIETYGAILAILLSGKAYIPIAANYPPERAQQIIQQSKIKTVISKGSVILSGDDRLLDSPPFLPDKEAYILFTSGSTGTPKGVPLSYRNLDSFAEAFFALGYNVTDNDRFLQMFDLTFDLSIMSFIIPLCVGACVYTVPDKGTKYTNVFSIMDDHSITVALMVPSILSYLRPYFSEISLPQLRYSLFCGEALHKDIITEWMACVPNAVIENVYGPTEATIFCLSYHITRTGPVLAYNGIVAIGKPMKGMSAIVINESIQLLNDGDKGELCLCGNQVTAGYLDADKNKAAFFELQNIRYYRTGDIVYKDDTGNFIYCGRVDQQVKVQGFRVELSEIEFHLKKITGNANVVALAINNVNDVVQVEVVFEGKKRNIDEVIEQLRTKLPHYMIPSQVHFVRSFPLNSNGKTDRNELKKIIANAT